MIKDRWVEHFSDLLNQPTDADLTIVDGIDQLPLIELMSRPIEEQELHQALRNTRLGKSPGPDGILPEILECFLFIFLATILNPRAAHLDGSHCLFPMIDYPRIRPVCPHLLLRRE